jgi:hypothetical protein
VSTHDDWWVSLYKGSVYRLQAGTWLFRTGIAGNFAC